MFPLRSYNYSYIKDRLEREYKQKVSLSTIIDRARKNDFYLRKPKRTVHDREVLTNYAGELIQHDSSYHLWAPNAQEKWYLITSLDDYSRLYPLCTTAKERNLMGSYPRSGNPDPYPWIAFLLLCRFPFYLPVCAGQRLFLAETSYDNR